MDEHLRRPNHGSPGVKRSSDSPEGGGAMQKQKLVRSDDPVNFYNIKKTGERKIEKFGTTASYYTVRIKDLEIQGLPTILETLGTIFQSILKHITEMIPTTDLVRISIDNPELDFPITLEFMPRSALTADRILSEIERLLQSYEQFVIDETFRIDIVHVHAPYGSGRKQKHYVDLARKLKSKGSVIQIKNKDELCCARAIVTSVAHIERPPLWNSIRQGRGKQTELARDLHRKAEVPMQKCDIGDVKRFQNVLPEYQIHVLSKEYFNAIVYTGPKGGIPIYLYHNDGHFDVITTITGFLDRSYFCQQCKIGYNTKETHICNEPCVYCRHLHTNEDEKWRSCDKCNRRFKNDTCFNMHLKKSKHGKCTCEVYYKCKICGQTVNMKRHKKAHACREKYCKTCKDFVTEEHLCYMQPIATEEKTNGKRNKKELFSYIFFDFECTQDDRLYCDAGYLPNENGKCKNCVKAWCGTFLHQPNLCVVQKVCKACLQNPVTATSRCKNCGKNERVFQGEGTCAEFCKWLFSEENTGATVICHNFKGYDSYPILHYLHENAVLPKVITTGSKYMSIKVPACDIRMIDSLNFIPIALANMPASFGETELAKGYFPHLFNRKENQSARLEHLPDLQYYTPESMKPEIRHKFLLWYEKNKNNPFNFQEELVRYCRSDVDILRKCCLKFRELFMNLTKKDDHQGIDPFENCITIAAACHLVFRSNFLSHESIAIIPPHGYRPEDEQSIAAYKWMAYLSHKKDISIQNGRHSQGEKHIGPYKVDGYYKHNEEEIVLEFHGCFWHGCQKCFSRNTVNPFNDMSMGDLNAKTLEKKRFLEDKGYSYISIRECDFKKDMENDLDMKHYIQGLEFVSPLEPRDAFFGGRTEAFKLYAEATHENQIKYYDVTSLYPFVNKTGKIPIGHPKVFTENFKDISRYEGLVKCKVLAPRGMHVPVLPMKCNGKLMFSLCRSCSEYHQTSPCKHTEQERAIIGTWVTDEVKEAVSQGYTVQKIYEVWHFEEISQYDPVLKTGGLFTEYVNTFLKVKQEASGWPEWCNTEDDKQLYIQQYNTKEGILLDYSKIVKNPGLRALAKLMLNSFWGKFGQRSNLPQTSYISDPAEFFDIMTSDKQRVKNIRFINNETVQLDWSYNDDFIEASSRSNVIIAAYTTAQARLKLYSYLRRLDKRVLYCDTDSVVFTVKPGEWEPPLGDYLGDLTDETPKNALTRFVTGGPKNYAYTLRKPMKNGESSVCKVRGITLNFKNLLDINFNAIKDMVTNQSKVDHISVVDENKIVRNPASGCVVTKREVKKYKIVFDKRVITDNYCTEPYGM